MPTFSLAANTDTRFCRATDRSGKRRDNAGSASFQNLEFHDSLPTQLRCRMTAQVRSGVVHEEPLQAKRIERYINQLAAVLLSDITAPVV